MKIRADDPLAMKNFISSVQNRVNELKASCGDDQEKINGRRVSYTSVHFELFKNLCVKI